MTSLTKDQTVYTVISITHTLIHKSEPNYMHNLLNPWDVGRRYTGFPHNSLWHRTPIYRLSANFPVASEAGIPAARYVNARRRTPVYRLCFLQLTGTGMPES